MTAVLTYGNHTHDPDEVVIRSIDKSRIFGPRGTAIEYVESWTLEGILQAANPAALTLKMNALENAYNDSGKNLIFSIDGARTQHVLLGSTGLGGPMVVRLTWTNQFDSEYTTYRSYEISIECRIPRVEDELMEFRESLVSSGGLPEFRIHTLRNGPPIVQMVSPRTPYRAVQSGTAVGYSRYPAASPSLFGNSSPPLVDREIGKDTPEVFRGKRTNYPIKWSYQFLSTGPLFSTPAPR